MNVIIKPIITEKMTAQAEKLNRYGFIVDKNSNRLEIKSAVEKQYGVSVTSVNTINVLGKSKTRFTKKGFSSGRANNYKKAIVTVAKGDTIDLYGNI